MKLYVRNMVCDRCKLAVAQILDQLQLAVQGIVLGEIDFGDQGLGSDQLAQLRMRLEALGFELVDDKRGRLIERIKLSVIDLVQHSAVLERIRLSDYLAKELHHDYNYLSTLFSTVEGITLEQYFIKQRTEKVKELLIYDEKSLAEIAYQLGYSSPAHLSSQFKKVTGMTPGQFKQLRDPRQRSAIDKV